MTTSSARPRPNLALRLSLIGLGGFVVFLAIASVILRDQIFQTLLDPGIPFQTYQRPPAPDYADAEAWVVRPQAEDSDAPAVFFIHPTTYDGGSHWNAPFDRPQEVEELERVVIPNFAAPFRVAGAQIYAPHYRQAALYTFMNNREDSIAARLLAYEDVRAAFSAFRIGIDGDRPLILVGVGQGALHGLGLLLDEVARDDALQARLAAAYLLEAPFPTELFNGSLEGLAPCRSVQDVRCVVAYATALPSERHRIETLTERSMSWDGEGGLSFVTDRALLCVNPLLWTTTEAYAPARLHRGGAAAEGLSAEDSPSAMASQTGAQCQNGVLMVEQPRVRALQRAGRLGEDRRVPDFNLFYMDLQQDAQRRLEALASLRAEENLYAPPLDAPVEVGEAVIIPVDPIRN